MRGRAPRAPWGRFPLSELCVAGGLVTAVVGLATIGSEKSFWLLGAAMSLAVLAGLELAIRQRRAAHGNPAPAVLRPPKRVR